MIIVMISITHWNVHMMVEIVVETMSIHNIAANVYVLKVVKWEICELMTLLPNPSASSKIFFSCVQNFLTVFNIFEYTQIFLTILKYENLLGEIFLN